MRNIILTAMLAATAALPTMASAQDAQRMDQRHEIRDDRRDLRHERREIQRDRRDMQRNRVAYVSPYRGWRYQPVTMGYQLRPAFYGQRYWVNDYGRYNVAAPQPSLGPLWQRPFAGQRPQRPRPSSTPQPRLVTAEQR